MSSYEFSGPPLDLDFPAMQNTGAFIAAVQQDPSFLGPSAAHCFLAFNVHKAVAAEALVDSDNNRVALEKRLTQKFGEHYFQCVVIILNPLRIPEATTP